MNLGCRRSRFQNLGGAFLAVRLGSLAGRPKINALLDRVLRDVVIDHVGISARHRGSESRRAKAMSGYALHSIDH